MRMPIDRARQRLYPGGSLRSPAWRDLRAAILRRAGGACEGTPAHPGCRAPDRQPHPETGATVVLTVAHLDHDPGHNDPGNLRALCQRCHNAWDAPHRRRNAARTRRSRRALRDLFDEAAHD